MSPPNVVVISIDGFGVAAAGAYGQTSLPTPGWDALAANAVTFDFVEAPAASWERVYGSFRSTESTGSPSVADAALYFAERGGWTCVGGDLQGVMSEFWPFECLAPFEIEAAEKPAVDEDETHALRWLAKAEQRFDELEKAPKDRPNLLWLHHEGASVAWDAPLDWRETLRDEEDPPAYAGVEPPALDLRGENVDPDRFLPYVFAWAGQAAAWDRLAEGIHLLRKRLDAKRPTTMIVFGLRGFPLGEHGVVGEGDLALRHPLLREERLHVPFFVLPPGGAFPGRRSFAICRSDRLLADLVGRGFEESTLEAVAADQPIDRAFAVVEEGDSVSVRTNAWRFVREEGVPRLYFKPDDKWEANDVAARRRETVEAFERWLEERKSGADPPLPEEATRL